MRVRDHANFETVGANSNSSSYIKKEVQESFLLLGVWGYPPIFKVPRSTGDSGGLENISPPHIEKEVQEISLLTGFQGCPLNIYYLAVTYGFVLTLKVVQERKTNL